MRNEDEQEIRERGRKIDGRGKKERDTKREGGRKE